MKLFLKEHTLLIALNILQFASILIIYWLDGYRNLLPALYAIFIGFFFFLPAIFFLPIFQSANVLSAFKQTFRNTG